jgi:pyrroline-5-carboxylate reductase
MQVGSSIKLIQCNTNVEVVEKCKYIFIAVKPDTYDNVLHEIKHDINDDKLIITMAAGYEIDQVKKIIGNRKVVRTMPNTPAIVGYGYTIVSFDELITSLEKNDIMEILNTFSEVQEVSEELINAYSSISGSGPAYVFMLIEAMADAAVMLGIPRMDAYKAVEYTVYGSSMLALNSTMHPGELKDMVCSPGGTTIEGVRTLEEKGFRSSIIECVINTYKKNFNISNIR